MSQVLLTGANGFVGGAVLAKLGENTRVFGRTKPNSPCQFIAGELSEQTDFSSICDGIDVIIHCAARAHVMQETAQSPLELYRQINTAATLKLARHAATCGVKRFIFVSSIKVNGEFTLPNQPFSASDPALPQDAYGISKAEAEHGLREIGRETGMEITIIRPPLVYGLGVKANFAAMLKIAKKNLPLPFGAINNARSIVALPNLVDLILCCITHPNAANQTFLVSDGEDISTTELLREMTLAWGKQPRLLPIPCKFLAFVLVIMGKKSMAQRLFGSLQLDITETCRALDWQPKPLLQDILRDCVIALNKDLK